MYRICTIAFEIWKLQNTPQHSWGIFLYMAGEFLTPAELQGIAVISQLNKIVKDPDGIFGLVKKNVDMSPVLITDENAEVKQWDWFVQFPETLRERLPGSCIGPDLFLRTLGIAEPQRRIENTRSILGKKTGTVEDPAFAVDTNGFSLTVLNGMCNENAMQMTKLAAEACIKPDKSWDASGFGNKPMIRAQYQQAMYDNIKQALRPTKSRPAYRIHDDCLASGDSVLSYLLSEMANGGLTDMLQSGVEVVIDGPATTQSILVLKSFAQKYGIVLDLKVGHLAFGLTEGEIIGKVRRHANYITYPPEIIEMLEPDERQKLNDYTYPDGNIYVVQDMGQAEEGISDSDMEEVKAEVGNIAQFNARRKDPHGHHPLKNTLRLPPKIETQPTAVYLARGGYLPLQFDIEEGALNGFNIEILRVSRLWTEEYGYGAGFKRKDA